MIEERCTSFPVYHFSPNAEGDSNLLQPLVPPHSTKVDSVVETENMELSLLAKVTFETSLS